MQVNQNRPGRPIKCVLIKRKYHRPGSISYQSPCLQQDFATCLRFAALAFFAVPAASGSASATTRILDMRGADALGAMNAAGLRTMQALLLITPADIILLLSNTWPQSIERPASTDVF